MPLLATLRRAYMALASFVLLAIVAAALPTAAHAWDITGSSRPGSDVNGDGKDDVVWYHNGGTNAAHALLSNGAGLLVYGGQWRQGLGVPDWAGLGDFNGDGKDEPAWFHADGAASGAVSVLPSNGSSFGFAVWAGGLGRPNWVGVGDFNGDRKDDLAWYHGTGDAVGTVSVLLSTGTSFTYAGRWRAGLGVPDWAGVGDYNNDGKDDLAWYHSDGAGTIHVLLSTGTSFNYNGHWGSGYGRPDWVGTGDFNGDRRDDLAWYHADGGSAQTVSVLLSNGSTAFSYSGQWATGVVRPEWAGVGDYNADGKDDLSWYQPGYATSGNINVLRNTGSSFAAGVSWAGGIGHPQWAGNGSKPIQSTGAGADFNNDGADDLAWYHKEDSQAISGVFSNGTSAFTNVSVWRTGMGNPDWAGAGDFNRDGKEDIAWYHKEGTQNISVATSNGSQFDGVSVWRQGMGNPDWAGVGDFTGDGKDDIAWYHKESQKISVARSDGTKFDLVNVWREGMGKPDWAGVGDFNGDGRDDIAWYHKEESQSISIALSNGTSFVDVRAWRSGMGRPDWAGVGDFTGDGRDDIAWYHKEGTQNIHVAWGDGTAFQRVDVWRTGMGMPDWAGVGSFNGDSKDDIAWYHKENSASISLAYSSGSAFVNVNVARSGMGVPDWAGPGDISRRYPTSYYYGAANHRVDTAGEADSFIAAFNGATSDDAARSLYDGLAPTDQSIVDQRIFSTIPRPRVVRRVDNGQLLFATDEGWGFGIESRSLGLQVGFDIDGAARVTSNYFDRLLPGDPVTAASLASAPEEGVAYPDSAEPFANEDKELMGSKSFDFTTSDGEKKVRAVGTVNFRRGKGRGYLTGYFSFGLGSKVYAQEPTLCMAVNQVYAWPNGSGSVSLSGPSGGASIATAEAQWATRCRPTDNPDATRPTAISLYGSWYKRRLMVSVQIQIARMQFLTDAKKWQGYHTVTAPANMYLPPQVIAND